MSIYGMRMYVYTQTHGQTDRQNFYRAHDVGLTQVRPKINMNEMKLNISTRSNGLFFLLWQLLCRNLTPKWMSDEFVCPNPLQITFIYTWHPNPYIYLLVALPYSDKNIINFTLILQGCCKNLQIWHLTPLQSFFSYILYEEVGGRVRSWHFQLCLLHNCVIQNS